MLANALEEVTGYSERLWGKAAGEKCGVFESDDARCAAASNAVHYSPPELLRLHADQNAESAARQAREPTLAALRDHAQRAYERQMRESRASSREARRRQIASLLRGEGRGNAGAAQYGLPGGDRLYYEPECTARRHELTRLLLGQGSSERSIVQASSPREPS